MFWIGAAVVLAVALLLARRFDRRRGWSKDPLQSPERDPGLSRARDEYVRNHLEHPSGEHGPQP